MSRNAKLALLVVLGLALLFLAYYLRAIFMPLGVALLVAYVLNPLVTRLENRGVPRMASIAGINLILLGIVALIVLWGIPAALAELKDFVRYSFTAQDAKINKVIVWGGAQLQDWLGAENWGEGVKNLKRKLEGHEGELVAAGGHLAGILLGFMTGSLGGFITVFSFIALVPVYLFYLLKNLNAWWDRLKHALPRAYRDRTLATLDRIHRAVLAFFRGQTTISFIEGAVIFVGLKMIGVKFSLLFGLMYALLSIFPYIGVAVGFTVVELFVLADTGGFGSRFFLVAGLFLLIQALEAAVLQPAILGKETGLHPIAIILGLLICGELFGFFGMLIAIPITSTLKIVFEDYVLPAYEEVADLTRVRRRSEAEGAPPSPPAVE